jgi:predicted secreted protein
MSTGALIGRDGLLQVAPTSSGTYITVGGIRNYNIDASADEIDGGSFDSGGWGNVLPGQKSATLTAQAVYLSSGNTTSNTLFDWFSSDTLRNWRIRFSTGTALNPHIRGDGRVKSYSVSADRNDIVLLDFSIGYAGALVATTSTG